MSTQLLFASGDLSAALRAQVEKMKKAIDNYDPASLQNRPIDELVSQFIAMASVEPLEIDEAGVKPEQRNAKVEVGGRFDYGLGDGGSIKVDGVEVTLRVPFKGDPELLRLRPSHFNFNPPYGAVAGRQILLTAAGPPQDAPRIKSDLEQALESLKQYAGWSRGDVMSHNTMLPGVARTAIEERRRRLGAVPDIASSFSFGKRKDGGTE